MSSAGGEGEEHTVGTGLAGLTGPNPQPSAPPHAGKALEEGPAGAQGPERPWRAGAGEGVAEQPRGPQRGGAEAQAG